MDTGSQPPLVKTSGFCSEKCVWLRRKIKTNKNMCIVSMLITLIIVCHFLFSNKNVKYEQYSQNGKIDYKISEYLYDNQLSTTDRTVISETSRTGNSVTDRTVISETSRTGNSVTDRTVISETSRTGNSVTDRTVISETDRTGNSVTDRTDISETDRTDISETDRTGITETDRTDISVTDSTAISNIYKEDTISSNKSEEQTVENSDRFLKKLALVGKQPIYESCTKKFPESLIIGVMKGGTEAYSSFLAIHPQIAMQFEMRATLFFGINYKNGFEWYRQQMPCSTEGQISIEKSPQYWPSSLAAKHIYDFNSNMKLILIVRDPITRAQSHFLQENSSNPEKMNGKTFEQLVLNSKGKVNPYCPYVALSSYSNVITRWLKYFKLSQIQIIDGDNFQRKPEEELQKTETFLGLQPYITPDMFVYDEERKIYCLTSCLPKGKGRPHPFIDPKVLFKLKQYFTPLNKKFSEMVGQRFNW